MAAEINAPTVNSKFSSFEEFYDFLQKYQKSVQQLFVIYSCRKLNGWRDRDVNKNLIYRYIEYHCKFGDAARDSVATERQTSTCKLGCKAFFKLKLSASKKFPVIYESSLQHENHPYSEMCYAAITENRRLSPKSRNEVEEMCKIGGNNQLIKNYVLQNKKKLLTNKDIANIRAGTKTCYKNDLKETIELLQNKHRCTVHVCCDEERYFKGLYFSNETMRAAMSAWPEIVFVDGTYSLVNRDLTLMVLLVEDGNGRSEVVGSALIDSKDSETLQWFANCFKNENFEASPKIKCFMTDKDMIERSVFEKTFPGVDMYLCLFHTLKTFRRVVTSKDMELKESEKKEIPLMLTNLVYSDDEADYMKKYKEFKKSRPMKIVDYYDKNWHKNRHQWLKCSIINENFNNATNNRLESINAKIKSVVNRRNPLSVFIEHYFQWYQSHTQENDLLMARQFLKKSVFVVGNEAIQYSEYLTQFAFEEVSKQLNSYKKITFCDCDIGAKTCMIKFKSTTIITTPTLCSCAFFKSMRLPCKHIFAVRTHFNLSIFLETLCAERWSREYAQRNQRLFDNENIDCNASQVWSNTTITVTPRKKVVTTQQKRKEISLVTDKIVSIISCLGGLRYDNELYMIKQTLQEIIKRNSKKKDIQTQGLQDLSTGMSQLEITKDNNQSISINDIKIQNSVKIIGRPSGLGKTTTAIRRKSSINVTSKKTQQERSPKTLNDSDKIIDAFQVKDKSTCKIHSKKMTIKKKKCPSPMIEFSTRTKQDQSPSSDDSNKNISASQVKDKDT